MIINQAAVQSIYHGFKTIFNMALDSAKPLYDRVATIVPSSAKDEVYKWLGKLPRMREWLGDRVIQNLGQFEYTIKNKSFEGTVGVSKEDIEDDSLGVYSPIVQQLGASAAEHPDEIVFELLPLGFTKKCFDGKNFFANNHPTGEKGVAYSNVSDLPLSSASYNTARTAMMSQVDEGGKPLNIVPNLLVVPPALEKTAKKILTAETVVEVVDVGETQQAVAVSNTDQDTAEVLVVPWLAAHPTKWFLLCTTKPVKPLIFQQRKKAQFVALDKVDDQAVFMKKEILYGVDCRDNAGFGLYQLAFGSTGEAS